MTRFDSAFRHSQFTKLIDDTDPAITSNITTVKLSKDFTPTLNTSVKYTIPFNNALYNPHSGHNSAGGGILSSTGFKIAGDTINEHFLDDDGQGNVRRYYLVSGVKTYANATQGTIDYDTGKIEFNALNIQAISGSHSTLSVTCQPHESQKDIKTDILLRTTQINENGSAVVPQPSKNYILTQDNSTADIPNNIRAGTTVQLEARITDR